MYDETNASYIARLCNFAKTCNFGNEKENNLRDQLVYGCHDDSLREKLFREETLTLKTARQIATAHEAARQNMNLFRGQQQTHDSATINKVMKVKADKRVSPRQGSTEVRRIIPGRAKCKFCGREHAFDRKQCPAFGKKCHTCGQENHFAKMCRMQGKRERHKNTEPSERERQRPVYTVTVDDFSNRAEYHVLDAHCQINCVLNVDTSAIIVRPTVNSVVLPMELDTGSAISMIPVDVYQSKFANCQLQPSNKVLRSFTGESVPCKGTFKVNVQYNSHNVELVLYVVPDSRGIPR